MTKHKKLLTLFLIGLFAVSITGCGLLDKIGPKPTPLTILKEAQENVKNQSGIKEKITVKSDDNSLGLGVGAESTVIYEFGEGKGYVETKTEDETILMYVSKDKLYLKDGDIDKFVDLTDSFLGELTLSMINFPELNDVYKQLNDKVMNLATEEDVTMEKAEITLNGKTEKVDKITLVLTKDKVRDILAEYIESMAGKIVGSAVDSLSEFQITMEEEITGEKMSEEEKEKVKQEMKDEMNKQLQEQIDAVEFSNIENVFYIKDGMILKQEESFNMKVDGETSSSKTIIEVIDYGDHVKCPEISEKDVISLDEYLGSELDDLFE